MKGERFLFTKITDVLTTEASMIEAVERGEGESGRLPFLFDPDCVSALASVLKRRLYQGPPIRWIVTSSFRYIDKFQDEMFRSLRNHGFPKPHLLPLQTLRDEKKTVGELIADYVNDNLSSVYRWAVVENNPHDVDGRRSDRYVLVNDGFDEEAARKVRSLLLLKPRQAKVLQPAPSFGSFYGIR